MARNVVIGKRTGDTRKKRKGIHSKKRTSNLKGSKNYTKKYTGQGK
jgi:hypothetical protein